MGLALTPDATTVDTDDGMVILDERKGRYFQLNGTGAVILRLLVDGITCEEAARRVSANYSVEYTRVTDDIENLVRSLRHAGLVS